jgi:hypothetical protein
VRRIFWPPRTAAGEAGLGAFAETAGEQRGNCDALSVVVLEVLGGDDPLRIHQEQARVGNAFGEAAGGGLVADAEGINDLRLGVRQQGIADLFALGEVFEHGRGVIADCGDAVALFLE